jgi:hypothetical protein
VLHQVDEDDNDKRDQKQESDLLRYHFHL